jgi:nucleoside-diphosphate-sugar epimerase
MNNKFNNIYITGGAGYVGSMLTPKLLSQGRKVTVLDLMIYGEDVLKPHPNLTIIKGDIRDTKLISESIKGHDAVIHLACISNDPSFDLSPELGRSINLDAFHPLVVASKKAGVNRFIYASSSSVYGIKEATNVNEEMLLEPLTDYSKFKAQCENILKDHQSPTFTTITIRPATVCGYSPRQRLDVVVNILTNLAFHKREITIFGGSQLRPNIHIKDMVDSYLALLDADTKIVEGEVFNVGDENRTVLELAQIVKSAVGNDVKLVTTSTNDNRSYHISSKKINDKIGYKTKRSIEDAVLELKKAFESGLLPDSLENERYFNIKRMQNLMLK